MKYRAIIQLTSSDPKVYKSMIRQIMNLLEHLHGQVVVKVVCHGASGKFCVEKDNINLEEINALLFQEVQIDVCHNMLISNHIEPTELITGIKIIPSGIAELVVRQQEGWSYIKAGF